LGDYFGTVGYTNSKEFWENQDCNDPAVFRISRAALL